MRCVGCSTAVASLSGTPPCAGSRTTGTSQARGRPAADGGGQIGVPPPPSLAVQRSRGGRSAEPGGDGRGPGRRVRRRGCGGGQGSGGRRRAEGTGVVAQARPCHGDDWRPAGVRATGTAAGAGEPGRKGAALQGGHSCGRRHALCDVTAGGGCGRRMWPPCRRTLPHHASSVSMPARRRAAPRRTATALLSPTSAQAPDRSRRRLPRPPQMSLSAAASAA